MADIKYSFLHFGESEILVRTFTGNIDFTEVIDSFEFILKNGLIRSNTVGLISDLLNGKLNFGLEKIKYIMDYIVSDVSLSGLKYALIINSSSNIVFPLLAAEEEPRVSIRPFATTEAAVKWMCG